MTVQNRSWSVFQIGAREHYAIPRALLSCGASARLVTDLWFTGPGRRLLPPSLQDRYHLEIPSRNVRSFSLPMLAFEASSRMSGLVGWPLIESRNRRFGSLGASVDFGDVVFSYSYAALDVFRKAHRKAWLVLGQIDPGPFEQELIEQLHERHGLQRPPKPSAEYWDRWSEEHQLADVIVVNSTWSRDALVRSGVSSDKIVVIPLAYESRGSNVREQDFPKQFSRQRPLEILFLGQVIVRKGAVELLQAVKKLRQAPVKWTIVGGGEEDLTRQFAAEPAVELVGPVARSAVRNYYSRSDAFILPTHSDGFAITQLEAAASGLPLIVSKHCGDVARHQESGFLLRDVTPEAIVEAVETILARPAMLKAMASRVSDLTNFSLRQIGERLIAAGSSDESENRVAHA